MKTFISTFAVCMVVGYLFLFFGGAMLLSHFWATFVFAMLLVAAIITLLLRQETRLEELEARLKQLETAREQTERPEEA